MLARAERRPGGWHGRARGMSETSRCGRPGRVSEPGDRDAVQRAGRFGVRGPRDDRVPRRRTGERRDGAVQSGDVAEQTAGHFPRHEYVVASGRSVSLVRDAWQRQRVAASPADRSHRRPRRPRRAPWVQRDSAAKRAPAPRRRVARPAGAAVSAPKSLAAGAESGSGGASDGGDGGDRRGDLGDQPAGLVGVDHVCQRGEKRRVAATRQGCLRNDGPD